MLPDVAAGAIRVACLMASIEGLTGAFKARKLRAVEVIAGQVRAAVAANSHGRIYTAVLEEYALGQAARLQSMLDDGVGLPALGGVPVAVKDNIEVMGLATSVGSVGLARGAAARSAAVIERLDAAGAVLIGKTNLDEAALGASGRNDRFGACLNPRYPGMLPGGSSAGSAAAVAAGHALLGIGTDTLGSIRIPAALCGLAGFKPTHSTWSTVGVVPLYAPFDTLGLLAGSIADLRAAVAALGPHAAVDAIALQGAGPGRGALTGGSAAQVPPARPRIAYLATGAVTCVRPDVEQSYRAAVSKLEGADFEVVEFPPFDFFAVARAAFWVVVHDFRERLAQRRDGAGLALGGELHALLRHAATLPASKFAAAQRAVHAAASGLRRALEQFDGLLTPTCPVAGLRMDEAVPATLATFVACANVAGLPAVTWPTADRGGSAPHSLQLIGRHGGDRMLLALAQRLQDVLDGPGPLP